MSDDLSSKIFEYSIITIIIAPIGRAICSFIKFIVKIFRWYKLKEITETLANNFLTKKEFEERMLSIENKINKLVEINERQFNENMR